MKRVKKSEEIQCVDFRYDEGIRGRTESDIAATITTRSSGYSGIPMVMNGGGELYEEIKNTKTNTKRVYATYGV